MSTRNAAMPLLPFLFLCSLFSLLCSVRGLEIQVEALSSVSCYGKNDGVAKVTVLSGDPPYEFIWPDTGERTDTAYLLTAGWHNASVKDTNMIVTQGVFILQPSPLNVRRYWYSVPSSCNSLGSVSALAYGGSPPYNYEWDSADNDFQLLTPPEPLVIYDEAVSSIFKIDDSSSSVLEYSTDILAYSGVYTMKVQPVKQFFIQCSAEIACIDPTKYRGLEFMAWKETNDGSLFVGIVDDNGAKYSIIEYRFPDPSNWTKNFFDFSALPVLNYTGIYFATGGDFHFYLDDLAFLPKTEDFVLGRNNATDLPIDSPSAVYASPGSYDVLITDSRGCSASLPDLEIDQTADLHSDAVVQGDTINITTTGGTPPYSYFLHLLTKNYTSPEGVFSDLQPDNYTVEVTDSRGCSEEVHVEVKRGGGPPPPTPPPSPLPPDVSISKYKVLNACLGTLAGICDILVLVCGVIVWRRRHDLRPHSPFFCFTILFGAFFGYIAAILAVLDDVTWSRVIAFSWTVDISVTIIYGTMFAKSMQILKILDNFTKFVSIDTTDRYMAKIFGFILIPELIILVVWSVLNSTVLQSQVTAGKSAVIFWNIFLMYKGIVGFVASFVCFRMRFKFSEYAEIKQIAYCHFLLEIILVFLFFFTLIAREKYSELFVVVQSFSVIVITSLPLLVLFSPFLKRGLKEWKEEKRTKKWQKLTMYT